MRFTTVGSVALMGIAFAAQAEEAKKKPNVLMIVVDDLNTWVGCMNQHPNAKTPNIDALAKRGTLFLNAHCQAPICGPSRASVMTGLRPSTTGLYGQLHSKNIKSDNPVTENIRFLPEYLADQGYKTMGTGKIFHGASPKKAFELFGSVGNCGPKRKRMAWPSKEVAKNAFRKGFRTQTDWGAFPEKDELMSDFKNAEWTVKRLQENHDKPFFLTVGFHRPHVPFYVPQKWFDMHPLDTIVTPPYLKDDQADVPEFSRRLNAMPQMPTVEWAKPNGEWKKIVQAYLACCTFVDHQAGKVIKALNDSKYADNTIIILWSDHGYHVGEKNRVAKHSLWNESTHVPMIIVLPGTNKAARCNRPVQLLDLYPTIIDVCGLPANKTNEGHSLKPLLMDPTCKWPHAAITTYARNNHKISTETYRYAHYQDNSEELYDYIKDPNEWHNLALDKNYSTIKEELKVHLPKVNVPWGKHSFYSVNPFFKELMKAKKDNH